MKSFAHYMTLILIIMFWIFRIVVAVTATYEIDFFVKPIDLRMEVIVIFITIISIALISKINIIGSVLYFISNEAYFGYEIYNIIKNGIVNEENYISLFFTTIGVILPIVSIIVTTIEKTYQPTGKKTDWFYKNNETDREMDDRADKNNYRIY